jgi:hypothetical protein
MARSYFSTVMDKPAGDVWAVARDFNGLAEWFAVAILSSEIEEGKSGDTVGGVRNFLFGETRIREHLLAMDDVERSYTYEFYEPKPFPVDNYKATLRVTPVTDGDGSFVEWWVTFDCAEADRAHWEGFFAAEVFKPALDSLRGYMAAR